MLGTYENEPWGGIVKMDKFYKLKICEIRLVDPKMEEYFWDIESIRDAAKAMKTQDQSVLPHIYLDFVYDMAN